MPEAEQIEHAIAALEAQRDLLGDAVVEPALAALREKLAGLRLEAANALLHGEERKLVTVLFADLVGFTALSERLDPEDVREIVNAYFSYWRDVIIAHRGEVEKFIGDAVMAVFGLRLTREDDTENAVRAALAMRQALDTLNRKVENEHGLRLAMRVGVNSGPAVVSVLREREGQDFVVIGDTVNLASRLEALAPANGILISHDAYRHVRGLFEVTPQAPFDVKGKSERVVTYLVERAKPRAFRPVTRGVEGVETQLVGREAEMASLQAACRRALAGDARCVTVVGEPGVGKSRVLLELVRWLDQWPEPITYFRARTSPNSSTAAYGLIRDMLSRQFEILDTDPASTALHKFRAGVVGILEPAEADRLGQFVGFDFSASASVQEALREGSLGEAGALLVRYLRATAQNPTVIFSEDLHWADDSSLDFIERLLNEAAAGRLLMVASARPGLFERRPGWGAADGRFTRLPLAPLTPEATLALVNDVLRNVAHLPGSLRDLILRRAEGNPFYVEELVKMLLDDGVIVRAGQAWHVRLEKLGRTRVPDTLSGVLQARLDTLARDEKDALQRASVVGRLFWDAAVTALADGRPADAQPDLVFEALCRRELIYERAYSTFAAAREYIFKHGLLRDVTYETVLIRTRREYHRRAAQWLEANSGERVSEYAGQIAEHYENAGDLLPAARHWQQAGDRAIHAGALIEGAALLERALRLTRPAKDINPALRAEHVRTLFALGAAYTQRGHMLPAMQHLEAALAEARALGDAELIVGSLQHLGLAAWRYGRYEQAREYLDETLNLAERLGHRGAQSFALRQLGNIRLLHGDHAQAESLLRHSIQIARREQDEDLLAAALNSLAIAVHRLGRLDESLAYHEEAIRLMSPRQDRATLSLYFGCQGWLAMERGDYEQGAALIEQSFTTARGTGGEFVLAPNYFFLGLAALARADTAGARSFAHGLLANHARTRVGYVTTMAAALCGAIYVRERNLAEGGPLLGWVLAHPAAEFAARSLAQRSRDEAARDALAQPGELEAALARGPQLDIEAALKSLAEAM